MKWLSGETCGIELDEMGLGRMIHMPILQTRRLRPRGSQGLPQNHTPELEEVCWLFLAFLRPDTSRLPSLSWAFCLSLNLPVLSCFSLFFLSGLGSFLLCLLCLQSAPLCLSLHACKLSCVRLCVTPWTGAHQAPLSSGFPRQGYWSGLSFPLQGVCPTRG